MMCLALLQSVSCVQAVTMFNVQRFTTDDEDIEKVDETSKDVSQKKILNDLLQRARSRANKRPRVVTAEVAPTSIHDRPANEHSCTTSVPSISLKGLSVDVGVTNVPKVVSTKADVSPKDGGESPRTKKSRRRLSNRRNSDAPRMIGAALVSQTNETAVQSEREKESRSEGTVVEAVGEVVKSVVTNQGQGNRPVEEVAEEWGLDKRLTETLHEEGVKHFFPIQVKVIPDIVATERHSHVQSRDICVSAPTGSGKTLVFVLGVLQALIQRRVTRLRALVLLPSRDLAVQVHDVFRTYARSTGLRVGLAIGHTNFLEEQLALVGGAALAGNPEATARATCLEGLRDYSGPDLINDLRFGQLDGGAALHVPTGGSSEVDIVVATPGRLLDHLEKTPGFTLQHLRYLVIDEADRLLHQSYHGWVRKVLEAAYRREPGIAAPLYNGVQRDSEGLGITGVEPLGRVSLDGVLLEPVTVRGRPLATGDRVRGPTVSTPPLRKLLFSATLTSSPQKLSELGVLNPIVYTAREAIAPSGTSAADRSKLLQRRGRDDSQEDCLDKGGGEKRLLAQETKRSTLDEAGVDDYDGNGIGGKEGLFSTPAMLEETYMVCEAQTKPLVLISLLRDTIHLHEGLSVVFTSSVDSTHRLFRLLQLFGGFHSKGVIEGVNNSRVPDVDAEDEEFDVGSVAEFSSSLGQHQRSHIVRRARAGAIRVIVCSDGMARGMDLEGVRLVVNYDVPSHAKTYLHRVGRTARAGERGKAVTIAKRGQMKRFRRMRAGVDGKRVRPDSSSPNESSLEALAPRYQRCLLNLKDVLEAEKAGELDPTAPVTAVDIE